MISYNQTEKENNLDTTLIDLRLDMGSLILINTKSVSVWWGLYGLSNTQPTLKVQFMKRLRSTEARLKKNCCL